MRQDITRQEAEALVNSVEWFHKIDLGGGIVTPGRDRDRKLQRIRMPEDLRGWTVLDVGAYDGYFSFEAEKRGAARVLATDWDAWAGVRAGFDRKFRPLKASFDTAKYLLDSKVESMTLSVYDLKDSGVGPFDLVLFLGVLYHLWHPLLALENLLAVTRKLLILETSVLNEDSDTPVMQFVRGRHVRDPTNWWFPNPACVSDMLRAVGFTAVRDLSSPDMTNRRVFHARRTPEVKRTIVISAFRRPRYLDIALRALMRCRGVEDYGILVFVDAGAPEKHEEFAQVCATHHVRLHFRSRNVGNCRNMLNAIRHAIAEGAEEVVYLEEDLLLRRDALEYIETAPRDSTFLSLSCGYGSREITYCSLGNVIAAGDFPELQEWVRSMKYVGVERPMYPGEYLDHKTTGHGAIFHAYAAALGKYTRFPPRPYVLHFGIVGNNSTRTEDVAEVERRIFSVAPEELVDNVVEIFRSGEYSQKVRDQFVPADFVYA